MSISQRVRVLWERIKHSSQAFNLFPSIPPATNDYDLRNQKISTRIFVFLLSIVLIILLLYNSLQTITQTITINTPTLEQYLNLYAKYPQTLQCPCTKISIEYENLVEVQYSFHQVCTSDFVTDEWIDYLTFSATNITLNYDDFLWTGSHSFQTLGAFCNLIQQAISNSLDQLYLTEFIDEFVMPFQLFQSQIQASSKQFRLQTQKSFLSSLSLVQNTPSDNSLSSALQTDYTFWIQNGSTFVSASPRLYDNCSCLSTPTCGYEAPIRHYPDQQVQFIVPGFYVGCYVIESLLQSNLQCFYNQTCLNLMTSYFSTDIQFNPIALNSSLPSQYFVNSTIQDLVNSLMVEEWNATENYTSYYVECQPSQCIYSYTARHGILYIVTTLIGLVGGLITVLKLLVPSVVKLIRKKFFSPRSESNDVERLQVRSIITKVKLWIITFNLFPSIPPATNDYDLRNQKISTRIFVFLLSIILIFLLLYNSLQTITQTITINTPTLEQYLNLYAKYPQTLQCPCTQISIEYENLVEVQYSFHQVCTSDFVTEEWIDYLGSSATYIIVWTTDFRWTGSFSFIALRAFCELMNSTIFDSLDQFYSDEYVNEFIIPLELFRSQVQASVEQFKAQTINSLLFSISMLQQTTQANSLYTTQLTNYYLWGGNSDNTISIVVTQHGDCYCDTTSSCVQQADMMDYNTGGTQFSVPGFYLGCYPIDALLQSNLQCFYNQTCLNLMTSYFSTDMQFNPIALNSSLPSQYFVNSTIQDLVNSLMIEEWNATENYTSYYVECQPSECIYSYTTRNGILYIVTTLIGLVGGLITVLKLLVPRLVGFVGKIFIDSRPRTDDNAQHGVSSLLTKVKLRIITFNLFPSIPPATNDYDLRNQKISTRIFVFLLSIILIILVLYNSLQTITQTITINTPTLKQYLNLYAKYPQTLQCPCTQISIEYEKLVEVQYSFHQVCTSDFVTEEWIEFLAIRRQTIQLHYDDFRWTAKYKFQALNAFCELMNSTIFNNLDRFYSEEYVSAFIIPLELFRSQVQASVKQFITLTVNNLLLSLSMIREVTRGDVLLSAMQNNYYLYEESITFQLPIAHSYGNCSCALSATCSSQSAMRDYSDDRVKFNVPGFYVGCYVIESLLQSNLQCFYDQTCVSIVQSYFYRIPSFNPIALNSSLPSQYSVNSTIQDLVNSLMAEEWNTTENYTSYYVECQPSQCIYSYTARHGILYIVTTLIGLVGGLITFFRLLVPRAVKFFMRYIIKSNSVAPFEVNIET